MNQRYNALVDFRAKSDFQAGDYSRLLAAIAPRAIAAVTTGTAAVFNRSQELVPVDTRKLKSIDTVNLKSSGSQSVAWEGDMVTGTVEYSADHAAYNEFGTGRRGAASGNAAPGITYNENWPGMSGSPYIRPALDESKPAIKAAFLDNGFTL